MSHFHARYGKEDESKFNETHALVNTRGGKRVARAIAMAAVKDLRTFRPFKTDAQLNFMYIFMNLGVTCKGTHVKAEGVRILIFCHGNACNVGCVLFSVCCYCIVFLCMHVPESQSS